MSTTHCQRAGERARETRKQRASECHTPTITPINTISLGTKHTCARIKIYIHIHTQTRTHARTHTHTQILEIPDPVTKIATISTLGQIGILTLPCVLQYGGAVCYSMLQCVAVCCSVLQCVAACCRMLQCDAVSCSAWQCVAVCLSVVH